MILGGTIKAYRVGRSWRIPIEEARHAFTAKKHSPAA
jgi:hypothetical protein